MERSVVWLRVLGAIIILGACAYWVWTDTNSSLVVTAALGLLGVNEIGNRNVKAIKQRHDSELQREQSSLSNGAKDKANE